MATLTAAASCVLLSVLNCSPFRHALPQGRLDHLTALADVSANCTLVFCVADSVLRNAFVRQTVLAGLAVALVQSVVVRASTA